MTLDAKSADQLAAERDMLGKPKLNPNEAASLSQLEVKLAESSLDRQRIAKQGGERAVEQKARAQSLFSENIHRSAK